MVVSIACNVKNKKGNYEMICKNCGHNFEGNYCNICGQNSNIPEVNSKFFFHEISNSIFQIDKGLFFTIKELFIRPGHSIREYINGKRAQHFKPISFVFVLSSIYVLLIHFLKKETVLGSLFLGLSEGLNNDNEKNSSIIVISQWIVNHYVYSTLLFLLIFSFASYLAFIKTNTNYFQHLVLNLYIEGQRMVIYLAFIPILYFINNKTDEVLLLALLITFAYTFWVYLQFFIIKKYFSKILLTLLTYVYFIIIFFIVIMSVFGISKLLE